MMNVQMPASSRTSERASLERRSDRVMHPHVWLPVAARIGLRGRP
jgi:hypothetical protein